MKKWIKAILLCAFTACFTLPTFSVSAASSKIVTPATGYTSADDVVYQTASGYVKNWGARGEDCTFLSEYAVDFYQGNDSYDVLSAKTGGTSQTNASSSALYKALKQTMTDSHSHQTSYKETRYQYCYTDCLKNDSEHISSFYSGKELTGDWDEATTWNREHTWPNSKGLGGNDENDIMMLRPTWVQENSSRGNTAYGESSSYFDPGVSTRGDCARIVLYVYTRWGNTSKMWGASGVMESMNVLLRWMEEDPVDTWEMGRNDAVQSITGTRNIFVDYPEYAWLLFSKDIPADMVTPSGEGNDFVPTPPQAEYVEIAADSTHKTEYKVGERFDLTGLKANVHYSDGSVKAADSSLFVVETTTITATTTTIKIKYDDMRFYVNITVVSDENTETPDDSSSDSDVTPDPEPPAIEPDIGTLPENGTTPGENVKIDRIEVAEDSNHKRVYMIGESFEVAGLKANVVYSDGTVKAADSSLFVVETGVITKNTSVVKIKYGDMRFYVNISVLNMGTSKPEDSVDSADSTLEENSQEEADSSGCQSAIGSVAAYVTLAMASAFVLKRKVK